MKKASKFIYGSLPPWEYLRAEVWSSMPYDTLDYWDDDGFVGVFEDLDKIERWAIGVHAIVEMVLCRLGGLDAETITRFDTEGFSGVAHQDMYQRSPIYETAHKRAEKVERWIIEDSGRSWKDYSEKMDALKVVSSRTPVARGKTIQKKWMP